MIERIHGRVEERGPDYVVLNLGAVSLRVMATNGTLSALGETGAAVSLLTHLYMREDLVVLYGFGSKEERDLFERLIAITGVGPRVAQSILSALAPSALRDAIEGEKVDALVRVPGIGRKTAQRVILELKGKLVPLGGPVAAPSASVPAESDLVSVLVGLGYSTSEVAEALRRIPSEEGLSDEDRLRAALRHFAAP